ncbi:MAG: HAD family hydrolase [Maricaulaceae bacterium]
MTQAICMWSGPRNLSTAMMRSFGSRADCTVWDEPFYAPFLLATGRDDPGRDKILAAHETDAKTVAKHCLQDTGTDYYFQKHMPLHMLDGFPLCWAKEAKHFFLLRHPKRVIASYVKVRPEVTVEDVGFRAQRRLYDMLTDMTGTPPPVIHSEDILKNPKTALSALCAAIDIPFDAAMLSWEAGPKAEDGAWAPHWYGNVINSTGFAPFNPNIPMIAPQYDRLLSACENDYKALEDMAIKT